MITEKLICSMVMSSVEAEYCIGVRVSKTEWLYVRGKWGMRKAECFDSG